MPKLRAYRNQHQLICSPNQLTGFYIMEVILGFFLKILLRQLVFETFSEKYLVLKFGYCKIAICTVYLVVCDFIEINSSKDFRQIIFSDFFNQLFVILSFVRKNSITWKIVWKSDMKPRRWGRHFALSASKYETSTRKEPQKQNNRVYYAKMEHSVWNIY